MIAWINQNQGFILAILTLVYVLSTIVLVCLTSLSIRQVQELEKARLRPTVLFNLEIRQKAVCASLRNVGPSPAFKVTIMVSPPIMTAIGGKERECAFIQRPLPFLPGGQEISDLLGGGPAFDQLYPDAVYRGTVSYEDKNRCVYSEPFEFGLWHQMNRYHTSSELEDLVRLAGEGVDAIEKLSETRHKA